MGQTTCIATQVLPPDTTERSAVALPPILQRALGYQRMILNIGDAIDSNPKKLSGEVCFAGTRVPVRTLFDCLTEGYTLEQFFDDFPTVSKDEVLTVLDFSRQCVEASGRKLVGDCTQESTGISSRQLR
jgi:uncharacterized protein (DUF433 family)